MRVRPTSTGQSLSWADLVRAMKRTIQASLDAHDSLVQLLDRARAHDAAGGGDGFLDLVAVSRRTIQDQLESLQALMRRLKEAQELDERVRRLETRVRELS